MEEEDVWRAVLNWAKYQAGVTQPTAHWTEEERARVCQHLSEPIKHVRLLLIGEHVLGGCPFTPVSPRVQLPSRARRDKLFFNFSDSQVFAEEVEPTGAVPMELSLERYRFAALPEKFRERSEDKRLQPRVSSKFFSGSQILINVSSAYSSVFFLRR